MNKERGELLKKLHETKDPKKRQAIATRIRAIDNENRREGTGVGKVLDQLDKPVRAVKKAVSGDENEWFSPDGLNPHVYAAGNTALDIVGDPLNYVGGALAAAGKAGAKIPGAISSISNYIPDWYGPDAAKKAKGAATWAGDAAASMGQHMMSPKSRALYGEQKITTPAQRRVANEPAGDIQVPKQVAQVQYSSGHIPTQQGQGASTNPAAKEILDRSFTQSYTPAEPGKISEAIQTYPVKINTTGKKKPTAKQRENLPEQFTSKEDADFVEEFVTSKQGNIDDFVLKAPVAKETGGHHNDVIYRSPAKAALKQAFADLMDADGNVDPKQLESWLRENHGKYNSQLKEAGRRKDSWNVVKSDESGVWLTGGRVGSAITEGGVMWLAKIKPDGEMAGYMIDKHDFAEKMLPSAQGKALVAITPTMSNNIKNIASAKGGIKAKVRDAEGNIVKEGRKHVTKDHVAPKTFIQTGHQGSKEDLYKDIISEYTKAVPSQKALNKERAAVSGEALLAERFTSNPNEENNQ